LQILLQAHPFITVEAVVVRPEVLLAHMVALAAVEIQQTVLVVTDRLAPQILVVAVAQEQRMQAKHLAVLVGLASSL
jgi:hypothetical protein